MIRIGIKLYAPTGKGDEPEIGTFVEPYPKVSVKKGANVIWVPSAPLVGFKLKFQGSSPFIDSSGDPILVVTNTTDPRLLKATVMGTFHYSVLATDGSNIHEIANCPELDVG